MDEIMPPTAVNIIQYSCGFSGPLEGNQAEKNHHMIAVYMYCMYVKSCIAEMLHV
jgi:hypothetical protein